MDSSGRQSGTFDVSNRQDHHRYQWPLDRQRVEGAYTYTYTIPFLADAEVDQHGRATPAHSSGYGHHLVLDSCCESGHPLSCSRCWTFFAITAFATTTPLLDIDDIIQC